MFRFETVVGILIVAMGLCTRAAAAESPVIQLSGNNTECNEIYKAREVFNKEVQTVWEKKQYEQKTAELNECYSRQSKSGNDCQNAPSDYKKAQKEFSVACGKANINGDCAKELSKCTKTNSDPDDEKDEPTPRKRDVNEPHDVDAVKKQCPAIAGKDLEKLEKELKDQQEKVKKLEKEIPEFEEKANKVLSSTNEKLQQIKTDQAESQKKLAENLQKIGDDKDGAEKAITDQITSIAAQISKAQDALGQVSLAKLEGQLKLKQTKTQADLNCHASASAQVAKMQADVLAATAAGTYNRAGFTGLLKNVGVSDRAAWQRQAKKYYQWCLDSKPTADTKDGANDGYKLLVAQSNKSEASIREQIRQLQAQQLTLSNPAACGPATRQANGSNGGETALCQSARKATEKANQLVQANQADQQTANEKYAQIQQQGTREYQSLENQAKKKSQEVSDEKKRLDNLQRFLEAKYAKAGGNSQVDGKGYAEAMELMVGLDSAAHMLISCKRTEALNHKPQPISDYCTGDCLGAQKFLKKIGTPDTDPDLADRATPIIAKGGNESGSEKKSNVTPPPAETSGDGKGAQ